MPLKVWYEEGLAFKCTGCGKCCTGAPGYVWLTEEDIQRFCTQLKLERKAFLKKYTRQVRGRYSLIEDPQNYDCVFLKEGRCTAYEARPKQCRTYPFWGKIMQSRRQWEAESNYCEGINSGPTLTREEIDEKLHL
ncbi:MAG: YkgJ family cysteine cluster protein [Simkaniaceae bacterium]|nr:YkgJ family cysteine cluster protein [Simkaniaceae bacterium]